MIHSPPVRERSTWLSLLAALILVLQASGHPAEPQKDAEEARETTLFVFPCEGYSKGLRGKGNFGLHVKSKRSAFHGSWHLAEDIWIEGGTEVRAIADGVVRYSAFSPTWTDARGQVHWNLGNVIVIEHALVPAEGELSAVCSFYVHLAANRRVAVGDKVKIGQVIGHIGKDRSEENGRYPAHLHFGLHRGPYIQIPPSLERELSGAAASDQGLRFGDVLLKGEIELERSGKSDVLIRSTDTGEVALLSLLVGSTAPENPPPDIMGWCEGYGERETLAEWFKPSDFLRKHAKR